MPANAAELKSRTIEVVILWIAIALFIALGVAREAYPRIYVHYHPFQVWSGDPNNWDSYGPSNGQESFFYACLTAALGFAQLRFSRWFQRDISKILMRFFLLAVFVMVAGLWTFSLANRFWTVEDNRLDLLGAEPGMELGKTLFRLGARSGLGVALLNLGYGLVRRRRV